MTKYIKQDEIDERGGKILQLSLNESYFSVNSFNGKTPDIDGELLRISMKKNKKCIGQNKNKSAIRSPN